jgi:hypothetical protein
MNRRLSKLRPSCHLAVKYRNSSILTHPFRTGGILGLICHQPETLVPGKPYITDTHIDEPAMLDLLDTPQNEIYLQPKEIYFTTEQIQTYLHTRTNPIAALSKKRGQHNHSLVFCPLIRAFYVIPY